MDVNLIGYRFIKEDGYGRYGIHLIRALARQGVNVHPQAAHMVYEAPSDVLQMAGTDWSRLSIFLMPPITVKAEPPPHSWIYTMHEDSKLPEGWAVTINQFERCIVPCEHNAEVFKEAGVTIPIDVVYGGTAPEEFPLRETPPARPYTFVCLSDRGSRKGWETVWGAFYEAFPESCDDVRLIVKGRPEMKPEWWTPEVVKDKRIRWWYENIADMNVVFREADCLVYPAHCDGWGMWWREGAMTGLVSLVTPYSGNAVGADEVAITLPNYVMSEAMLDYSRGQWAKPDQSEVAAKMRWCYEHREEAAAKGLAGASWLRANQTWDHTAKGLIQLIEKHG